MLICKRDGHQLLLSIISSELPGNGEKSIGREICDTVHQSLAGGVLAVLADVDVWVDVDVSVGSWHEA